MRAIVMKEFGPPSVLRIADQPEPVPGPNQVTIEVAMRAYTTRHRGAEL